MRAYGRPVYKMMGEPYLLWYWEDRNDHGWFIGPAKQYKTNRGALHIRSKGTKVYIQ